MEILKQIDAEVELQNASRVHEVRTDPLITYVLLAVGVCLCALLIAKTVRTIRR